MSATRITTKVAICGLLMALLVSANAQDSPNRKEAKRVELSGAPNMEVVSSISEYKKGEMLGRHFHHGVETGYVIQGTMIQMPGKEPTMMETGSVILNLREVVHGFTVVGDTPLRLFTVHVVDKGKPLYDEAK